MIAATARPLTGPTANATLDAPRVERAALRVAFAGGGTGGHIVPGVHLLAHARAAGIPIADLVWFLSGRPVEERVLAGARRELDGLALERVPLAIEPESGGAPSRARLVVATPGAAWRARRALARHRAQVVVGLGGFTSLPVALAARSLGIPLVLLEVNAAAGAATRWLSRGAARTLHAWRTSLPPDPARDLLIGPVVSPELARDARTDASAAHARRALGFAPDRPLLVVLGGSQGSSALNGFVRAHAATILASGAQILHQTGPGKLGESAVAAPGYVAQEYVHPASDALAAATLVLCRGGASTLAEIAALRVPALVAPYPHHADRHQERNALELASGVRIVQDAELDERCAASIVRLLGEAGRADRAAMTSSLSRVSVDGAARAWSEIEKIVRERERSSPRRVEKT